MTASRWPVRRPYGRAGLTQVTPHSASDTAISADEPGTLRSQRAPCGGVARRVRRARTVPTPTGFDPCRTGGPPRRRPTTLTTLRPTPAEGRAQCRPATDPAGHRTRQRARRNPAGQVAARRPGFERRRRGRHRPGAHRAARRRRRAAISPPEKSCATSPSTPPGTTDLPAPPKAPNRKIPDPKAKPGLFRCLGTPQRRADRI